MQQQIKERDRLIEHKDEIIAFLGRQLRSIQSSSTNALASISLADDSSDSFAKASAMMNLLEDDDGDSSHPQSPPSPPPSTNATTTSVPLREFTDFYTLGSQLGSGGFAVTFEAFSTADPQVRVAVKVVQRVGLSETDEKAFHREVDIMRGLDHPNIVHYIDFFQDDKQYYVVLELVEGGELFDRIVQKTFYNESEARDLVSLLLRAIKYLHDLDIVHR